MNAFEENKVLLKGEFGKTLLDIGSLYSIPIYWLSEKHQEWTVDNNGTGFVLNTGSRVFFVTAAHVYHSYLELLKASDDICLQLMDVRIPLCDRLISDGTKSNIDVATFELTDAEVKAIGCTVLRGSSLKWPPPEPNENEGVFFTGFPGSTRIESRDVASFGRYQIFTPVNSVSRNGFSCLLEREFWIKIRDIPPEKYDLGGASGAPALLIEESDGKVLSWRFVGILYEASRELGEIVMFHHANVISENGIVQGSA